MGGVACANFFHVHTPLCLGGLFQTCALWRADFLKHAPMQSRVGRPFGVRHPHSSPWADFLEFITTIPHLRRTLWVSLLNMTDILESPFYHGQTLRGTWYLYFTLQIGQTSMLTLQPFLGRTFWSSWHNIHLQTWLARLREILGKLQNLITSSILDQLTWYLKSILR